MDSENSYWELRDLFWAKGNPYKVSLFSSILEHFPQKKTCTFIKFSAFCFLPPTNANK